MSQVPVEWSELAKVWQAESAAISVDEIDGYLRRERASMARLASAEAASLILGLATGVWLAANTTFIILGWLFIVFLAITGFLAWRMRTEPELRGGDDLLTTLAASVAREEWNAEQLRIGRAVSFVALFGIVMLASNELRHFDMVLVTPLWVLLLAAAWVLATVAWNFMLARRSRRRKTRLMGFAARLKSEL